MIYDLIIIGGGPAGITAGIYAIRQKLNTLLITKNFGGQVARKTVEIENYPGLEKISGQDLIKKFEFQLRKLKIDIERDEVKNIKKIKDKFVVITKSKNNFQSKTVIIATGADPRPLEAKGEKEFLGKGVSYCPQCDGPLFEGKIVAVIGGGNAGFETAFYLAKLAKKVYILEFNKEVRADQENQEKVRKTKKVEIITNVQVKEIKGNHFVSSLVFQNRETKSHFEMPVHGVFVEIGYQPATAFAKNLVDFNERDEIKVDFENFQTKTPGLFAAGDCNMGKYKQIITAAGEGAKAALAAYDYLKEKKLI